jgi:uncharacterized cupredoxin-like copper-binding protein
MLKEGQVIFFNSQNTPGFSHEKSLQHPPKQLQSTAALLQTLKNNFTKTKNAILLVYRNPSFQKSRHAKLT